MKKKTKGGSIGESTHATLQLKTFRQDDGRTRIRVLWPYEDWIVLSVCHIRESSGQEDTQQIYLLPEHALWLRNVLEEIEVSWDQLAGKEVKTDAPAKKARRRRSGPRQLQVVPISKEVGRADGSQPPDTMA